MSARILLAIAALMVGVSLGEAIEKSTHKCQIWRVDRIKPYRCLDGTAWATVMFMPQNEPGPAIAGIVGSELVGPLVCDTVYTIYPSMWLKARMEKRK